MQHTKEPGAAHHAFLRDVLGVSAKYGANGMSGVERIAVLAQSIGQEISKLPSDVPFTAQELLYSVARNIEAGNQRPAGVTS